MREAQELAASQRAQTPMTGRLHWEMAQRYAFLASEEEFTFAADIRALQPAVVGPSAKT